MVLKEAHFPIQTLQMLQQERKKKKECFEWKKHYPSPNKFYLILFSNIQQYQHNINCVSKAVSLRGSGAGTAPLVRKYLIPS